MHVLLINKNPVVSRLMHLCMRSDVYILEEIAEVGALSRDHYDVVFVDEDLYVNEVQELTKLLVTKKRVFLSSEIEEMMGFDVSIMKPFLPSQVTNVLEDASLLEEPASQAESLMLIHDEALEETEDVLNELTVDLDDVKAETSEEVESIDSIVKSSEILDLGEIEKIKELLEMDEDAPIQEGLSDEEYENRKVAVIKEQLMADGLEIISEDEYVEELGTKERKVSKRDDREKLKKLFEKAVNKMSKKKIKKLLNGEKVKIQLKRSKSE